MINHMPNMYNLRGQTVDKFGRDHTGCVQYQFNHQGFRSNIEFDSVPQCALFGCSLVFGIGVDVGSTTASLLPNTYNFGLCGNYNNNDIHKIIVDFLTSNLYSQQTKMSVVWTHRDQDSLERIIKDLHSINLYHFFCGDLLPGKNCFKFVKNLDQDVSLTHMGPQTHATFAKMLWALFNQF